MAAEQDRTRADPGEASEPTVPGEVTDERLADMAPGEVAGLLVDLEARSLAAWDWAGEARWDEGEHARRLREAARVDSVFRDALFLTMESGIRKPGEELSAFIERISLEEGCKTEPGPPGQLLNTGPPLGPASREAAGPASGQDPDGQSGELEHRQQPERDRVADQGPAEGDIPGGIFADAIATIDRRAAQQDQQAARWVRGAREQQELRDARRAGAETADQVVRAQLDAGMSPGAVDRSAEQVLGGRFENPTPVSDAFYGAYDDVAAAYVADARRDIEAG